MKLDIDLRSFASDIKGIARAYNDAKEMLTYHDTHNYVPATRPAGVDWSKWRQKRQDWREQRAGMQEQVEIAGKGVYFLYRLGLVTLDITTGHYAYRKRG